MTVSDSDSQLHTEDWTMDGDESFRLFGIILMLQLDIIWTTAGLIYSWIYIFMDSIFGWTNVFVVSRDYCVQKQ